MLLTSNLYRYREIDQVRRRFREGGGYTVDLQLIILHAYSSPARWNIAHALTLRRVTAEFETWYFYRIWNLILVFHGS